MESTARRARDEWLALRCKLGERDAFAELVREMERPLLYYAMKLLKDESKAFDVLQEVWLIALRTIKRLTQPASLRPWLYRIAHGLAVDRIRKDNVRQTAENIHAESIPEHVEEPSFDTEDAAALHRAFDQIDEKFREVLILHFLEQFSVAEVATAIGCPEGTVKSRIYHAKHALKNALERGGYGISK